MKIYVKPTDEHPNDVRLEDLLKERDLTPDSLPEDELDQLLHEAKAEYDETWTHEAESQVPEGLEERLLATIQKLEAEAPTTTQDEAPIVSMPHRRKAEPPRIGQKWLARAAACVAALLVAAIAYNMHDSGNAFADTCKTPEEAQQQLERAIGLLSKNGAMLASADVMLQQATKPRENTLSKYITFE